MDEGIFIDCWVLRPKSQKSKILPAMVYCHGGGSIFSRPEDTRYQFHDICVKWNCCIIKPKYRLSPEHKQPIGQKDCMKAFLWFHKNAKDILIDPKRMAFAGESGGGVNCLGAVRQMILTGDVNKIRVCFLHEPMLSGSYINVPTENQTAEEQTSGPGMQWCWSLMTENYKQALADSDPVIFPGRMPDA